MGIVKARNITPLQAIRKHCLQCSCGDKNEVDNCVIQGCPLYNFRFGENGKPSENTETTCVGDLLDKKGAKVAKEPHITIEIEDTVKEPDETIESVSKVETETVPSCENLEPLSVESESKSSIEDGHKPVVNTVEVKEEPAPKKKRQSKKKVESVEQKVVEEQPNNIESNKTVTVEENQEQQNLDDLDVEDLFD